MKDNHVKRVYRDTGIRTKDEKTSSTNGQGTVNQTWYCYEHIGDEPSRQQLEYLRTLQNNEQKSRQNK